MKRKVFTFEVTIGHTEEVTVVSSADDEWGDEAKILIDNAIEDVQAFGLPGSNFENEIEGDTIEELKDAATEKFGYGDVLIILNEEEDFDNPLKF